MACSGREVHRAVSRGTTLVGVVSEASSLPIRTTTWTRNIDDLGGGLGILECSDGTARLQLSDLRGNVVGSATIGGTAIDSYASYTEYGLARTAVPVEYEGYGWLGRFSRKSAGNVGGVTLMGARLYNPTTGRFLSRDSVQGGNDNAYVYPPDPINKIDLDGRSWLSRLIIKLIVKIIVKVVLPVVKKAAAVARKKAATKKKPLKTSPAAARAQGMKKIPDGAKPFVVQRDVRARLGLYEPEWYYAGQRLHTSQDRDINLIDCGLAVLAVGGGAAVYAASAPVSVPITIASAILGGGSMWSFFRSC